MNVSPALQRAIESSPIWIEMTRQMNLEVAEWNKQGRKMPDRYRDNLREIRLLLVLSKDDKVRRMFSDEMFDSFQAEKKIA